MGPPLWQLQFKCQVHSAGDTKDLGSEWALWLTTGACKRDSILSAPQGQHFPVSMGRRPCRWRATSPELRSGFSILHAPCSIHHSTFWTELRLPKGKYFCLGYYIFEHYQLALGRRWPRPDSESIKCSNFNQLPVQVLPSTLKVWCQSHKERGRAPFVRQLHPDARGPLSLAVGKPQIARCPGQGYAAPSPGEFWCFCQIDEHAQKQGFKWKESRRRRSRRRRQAARTRTSHKASLEENRNPTPCFILCAPCWKTNNNNYLDNNFRYLCSSRAQQKAKWNSTQLQRRAKGSKGARTSAGGAQVWIFCHSPWLWWSGHRVGGFGNGIRNGWGHGHGCGRWSWWHCVWSDDL